MSDTVKILQLCSIKLQQLGQRVDELRSSTSEPAVSPPAPPSTPVAGISLASIAVESIVSDIMERVTGTRDKVFEDIPVKKKRASPRCHECHGPVSGYHQDYPHGLNVCQLEHYDYCEGDILEGKNRSGHYWRGCPDDYAPPQYSDLASGGFADTAVGTQLSAVVFSDDEDTSEYIPSRSPSPATRERVKTRSTNVENLSTDLDNLDVNETRSQPGFKLPTPVPKNPLGKSKEDLLLEAELAEIEVLKEKAKKLELLKKARAEKQRMRDSIENLSNQGESVDDRRKKSLHEVVDKVQARGRDNSHAYKPTIYSGPDMNTIRRDEYTRRRVDREMEEVVEIPALSNARPEQPPGRAALGPRLKAAGRRERVISEADVQFHPHRDLPYTSLREVQPRRRQEPENILYKVVTTYDHTRH